jgi:phenylacetate-CoA ligase
VSAPLARALRSLSARKSGIAGPLREALRIERMDRTEIDGLVSVKLAALVAFAYERVPFLRERLTLAGVDPGRVRTIRDLASVPPMSKDDLRGRGVELLAGGKVDPAWIANASGGSTGVPVRFYQDLDYHRTMLADQARHVTWTGLPWWTPRALVWGADRDATDHTSALGRLRDGVEGTAFLNTFRATDADYVRFAERCARAQVPLLIGYSSALEHFARVAQGSGFRPRAVQSSAERLTPSMRTRIEQAFGAPVFDRYGSREMGNAAHECTAHDGLHVSMERVVVEILKGGTSAATGEEGEIVVTVLDNRAEPLIRYATGDLGRLLPDAPCACGRTYAKLEITAGRTSDVFTAPSGRRVHGEYFTHLFYGREGIAAFRVIQETRERIVLELVRGAGDGEADARFVIDGIVELDPAFRVETRWVDAIPQAESGKRRFTVSQVPLEW